MVQGGLHGFTQGFESHASWKPSVVGGWVGKGYRLNHVQEWTLQLSFVVDQ